MILFRRRLRKLIISVSLGCWLFAFFLGVVNACEVAGELAAASSYHIATHDHDDATTTACEHFCADNPPIVVKAKTFPEQGGEQPLLIAPVFRTLIVTGDSHMVVLTVDPSPTALRAVRALSPSRAIARPTVAASLLVVSGTRSIDRPRPVPRD